MTQTAIQLEHIEKRYRNSWGKASSALDDVSLRVQAGEAFGFIGPNGAGKSTTIKILLGIIRADKGTARMFDYPVNDFRARTGLGYVPENPSLYNYLTPLETLTMGLRLHKVGVDDLHRHAMSWLERFDLAHVANKRIRSFSKGMAQRTALAHALALKPRMLILDEPLSGLDPVGRRDVVDILMEFRHQGGTLFFSSHVLHDVERLADRFGLIHKGKLRTVQHPGELMDDGDARTVIRSSGADPVAGMSADVAGRWFVELPAKDVWSMLDTLRSAGHTIIEVRQKLSLEQIFMQYIEKDANP